MLHTFVDDVNEIARGLIEAFSLSFDELDQYLNDPLVRWLDFRLRYIEPRPRYTLKSADFELRVPPHSRAALKAFLSLSKAGADLNPFQTKQIKRNDKRLAQHIDTALLEQSSQFVVTAAAEGVAEPVLSLRVDPNGRLAIV